LQYHHQHFHHFITHTSVVQEHDMQCTFQL
jgi:hypothetical protein